MMLTLIRMPAGYAVRDGAEMDHFADSAVGAVCLLANLGVAPDVLTRAAEIAAMEQGASLEFDVGASAFTRPSPTTPLSAELPDEDVEDELAEDQE